MHLKKSCTRNELTVSVANRRRRNGRKNRSLATGDIHETARPALKASKLVSVQ